MEDYKIMRAATKQSHDERVKKNPERLAYAVKMLDDNDIQFSVKNERTGHIHCWDRNDNLIQFYAGTGKIQGHQERGIHNLIKLLTKAQRGS